MTPRVLTVEDEPDLRLILQDNLEFEGYEVLSAFFLEDLLAPNEHVNS